jgi:hypothetical protein
MPHNEGVLNQSSRYAGFPSTLITRGRAWRSSRQRRSSSGIYFWTQRPDPPHKQLHGHLRLNTSMCNSVDAEGHAERWYDPRYHRPQGRPSKTGGILVESLHEHPARF